MRQRKMSSFIAHLMLFFKFSNEAERKWCGFIANFLQLCTFYHCLIRYLGPPANRRSGHRGKCPACQVGNPALHTHTHTQHVHTHTFQGLWPTTILSDMYIRLTTRWVPALFLIYPPITLISSYSHYSCVKAWLYRNGAWLLPICRK